MKILELKVDNIKAIRAIDITPKSNMVEITGRNGQGKSSVLDAIWWALAGTRHIQSVPIRDGEDRARIRLNMGELVVERKFTDTGTKLTAKNADGATYSSPQAMLDDMLGALTFDPLEFVNQKPKEQFETLRETLGLDFAELDADIETTFTRRAEANANGKELRASINTMEIVGEVPEKPVDVDDLTARIGKASDHNADIMRRVTNRENADRRIHSLIDDAANLRAEAMKLEQEADDLADQIKKAGPLPLEINIDDLREQLNAANQRNEAFKAWQLREKMDTEATAHETRATDLTLELVNLRAQKATMIAAAEMPVDGMAFGDGVVMLDGVPFDQASTAQQLRASVALAMAANPKLKVIRVKQGSFLDDDGMKLLADMADEHDYQIWIERVDSTGKVGIVIEDGSVVAVNEKVA